MTQSALILINTDCTGHSYAKPGETALRCDVCGEKFQELRLLHHHLHQLHKLEPQDWGP